MLEISGLKVNYGAIRALHGISLKVERGAIVTLVGSNGAGKSTTLRAISGIVRPAAGTITYEGRSIARMAPHEIVRLGLVQAPEGRGIFANLSVEENLKLGATTRSDAAGVARDWEMALNLFPRVRERLHQSAGTLSGGEQQMLAIARALLARPRLLLLDEPSLGLAPQICQTIFRIIREINASGTTILLVEQNARAAMRIAHYAYVLEVGKIDLEGPSEKLAASDEVRRRYLGVH
ncbi:MAG: ABC transporter ATP-binding protein [Planctomycetota bacterium]|nr:ABC transporter ATP-binding protein [Planctomycetota bacterium]